MTAKPNIVFLFVDQLRAASLPLYGERQIETPHIDRLASQGMVMNNSISSCPVCTPARAMLVTGRHPQTTGHLINSTRTRHSEISIADAFAHQGYRTGWVGKWHLHTGVWPAIDRMPQHPDWVPEGRDRLGFDYWRAYNQHMVFFDGFVQSGDWNYERWEGYETDGLLKYAREFMDAAGAEPFLLFVSPHPPHPTPFKFAPDHYYERLPQRLRLPDNVPPESLEASLEMYRHYLAMILAVDDMVGKLTDYLEESGRAEDTVLVFSSDHGTSGGSHGVHPWQKKHPFEESLRVPHIIRYPGVIEAGATHDGLFNITDFFPSLCSLCEIPVPRSVEGVDLSAAWRGAPESEQQEAALIMNFSRKFDWFVDGMEWRGVRTKTHVYARWLNGKTQLYDLTQDPMQMRNLAGDSGSVSLEKEMQERLHQLQVLRGDELVPCTQWKGWLDNQRRVVRNGFGPLGDPEGLPDWSLLH
ncbi:MAG: sulfatase [Myxococcota bacterium]